MSTIRPRAVSPGSPSFWAAWRPASIDITYACTFWAIKAGVRPSRIFQSVAAGLLGREAAVAGGAPTAALGLALHFFIALTVAFVYYTAARYAEALWRRPWVFGSLYGVAVFGVMHYIVVPLSAAGGGGVAPFDLRLGWPVDRRARIRDRCAGRVWRSRGAPRTRRSAASSGRRRPPAREPPRSRPLREASGPA